MWEENHKVAWKRYVFIKRFLEKFSKLKVN